MLGSGVYEARLTAGGRHEDVRLVPSDDLLACRFGLPSFVAMVIVPSDQGCGRPADSRILAQMVEDDEGMANAGALLAVGVKHPPPPAVAVEEAP